MKKNASVICDQTDYQGRKAIFIHYVSQMGTMMSSMMFYVD